MTREGIRGWLLVYMIALAIQLVHGIGLTLAAIVIYSNPSIAGLHSFVPFGALLFYVFTNVVAASYAIVLLFLMSKGDAPPSRTTSSSTSCPCRFLFHGTSWERSPTSVR
jgi:hypothetical protein